MFPSISLKFAFVVSLIRDTIELLPPPSPFCSSIDKISIKSARLSIVIYHMRKGGGEEGEIKDLELYYANAPCSDMRKPPRDSIKPEKRIA
jgi:hypothetical protein